MSKPSVFIGSSTEGIEFARSVRTALEQEAEITVWNENFFELGNTYIESLLNGLSRFDFAVLMLTPDDLINSRGADTFSPRDNVLFELGLFMAHLGRSRTFVVHQRGSNIKILSDLSGVTLATYDWPRQDKNYDAAVGSACDKMRRIIRDLGISEAKVRKQVNEIQTRQEDAEKRISQTENKLESLFAFTMSDSMFDNLKKIETGNFGLYQNSGGLRRELRHLRDIGYIVCKGHIGHIPEKGDNLSNFVSITPVGKKFVDFRNSLEKIGQ
jgi:Predicted nucleotide-binding protein containing TIR-like domain